MAFLDCTVVPVALPSVALELGGGMAVQQWVLDGYMLTLAALLLLGGALGDRYGRKRVFVAGLTAFAIASLACGLAPSGVGLVLARLAQGAGAALLVPGSLALINSVVRSEDRGKAVGLWTGLSGVATALGPVLGGWLVNAASWRVVFFINVPLAALAIWVAVRHVPERHGDQPHGRLDVVGAIAILAGLGGVTYALIEVPTHGWSLASMLAVAVGAVGLMMFPWLEARVTAPLLPLGLFRSVQFTGANVATFALEGATGAAFFLLALQLQQTLGYTALAAGLAMFPITTVMVLLSPRVGALAGRIGPRMPMTLGLLLCAGGLALLTPVAPGVSYWTAVFPAVLVLALGLAVSIAPLTVAVLAAVDERYAGAASGANNTIAWAAGLVAVAALPPVAGINATDGAELGPGFATAMVVAAVACTVASAVAFVSLRHTPRHGGHEPHPHATSPTQVGTGVLGRANCASIQ